MDARVRTRRERATGCAPIGGASAWLAGEMRERDDWIFAVTDQEIEEIDRAIERTRALDIREIEKDNFQLPTLAKRLERLRAAVKDGIGFSYVRGLPVDRYDREGQLRMYWGISRHIGDPIPQNRNGHLIGHILDVGDAIGDYNKRLSQTRSELAFHSDSCDVVGLLCLRTAKAGGLSAIVSAVAVHDEMLRRAPRLCAALYQPVLQDRRGEIPAGATPWFQMPVFAVHKGRFASYGPTPQYIESARRFTDAPAMTDEQNEAIKLFSEVCADERFCLRLPFQPGDIQFLQNHVVYHSRTEFEDWPDPTRKRHLLRIWLSLPDGRELPRSFLNKWPNIEVGTKRGGAIVTPGKPLVVPFDPETPAFG
jgi:TfdA family taurine catabolism dioxygenase TauD